MDSVRLWAWPFALTLLLLALFFSQAAFAARSHAVPMAMAVFLAFASVLVVLATPTQGAQRLGKAIAVIIAVAIVLDAVIRFTKALI